MLLHIQGEKQQAIPLVGFPFTIGRRGEKNLVITDPMASRDHAEIVQRVFDVFQTAELTRPPATG